MSDEPQFYDERILEQMQKHAQARRRRKLEEADRLLTPEQWAEKAKVLRALEAEGRALGLPAEKPSEPLTGRAEQVYQAILAAGCLTGKQLESKTGIDQSTLRKTIIPELKRLRGIVNKPGAGYYDPVRYVSQ